MAAFSEGMRAASTQAEDTYKVVAVLRALGDDLPKKTRINGEDIRKLVKDLEARGLVIPGRPVSDVEVRSLRSGVVAQMPKITLRGIPYKGKQTSAVIDEDELARLKVRQQWQEFEFMLEQQGDSIEKLDARIAEANDPLMKVYNARNPKRK